MSDPIPVIHGKVTFVREDASTCAVIADDFPYTPKVEVVLNSAQRFTLARVLAPEALSVADHQAHERQTDIQALRERAEKLRVFVLWRQGDPRYVPGSLQVLTEEDLADDLVRKEPS